MTSIENKNGLLEQALNIADTNLPEHLLEIKHRATLTKLLKRVHKLVNSQPNVPIDTEEHEYVETSILQPDQIKKLIVRLTLTDALNLYPQEAKISYKITGGTRELYPWEVYTLTPTSFEAGDLYGNDLMGTRAAQPYIDLFVDLVEQVERNQSQGKHHTKAPQKKT